MFTVFEIPFPENVTVKNYKNHAIDIFQLVKKGNFVHVMNTDFDNYADAAEALAQEQAVKAFQCIQIIVDYKPAGLPGIYRIEKMNDYLRDSEVAMQKTLIFEWGHQPNLAPVQQQGAPLFIPAAAAKVESKGIDVPGKILAVQSNEIPEKEDFALFRP